MSIGLMVANWFILLCVVVALIALRLVVIAREEAQLVAGFGGEYCRYRSGTGSLLPLRLRTGLRRSDVRHVQ